MSIGSSKRDKKVQVELMGETIIIERIGTDGDMEAAAQKFQELDGSGTVDAFGLGGINLSLVADGKAYPLYDAHKVVRFVKETPLVDGTQIKSTLEGRVAAFLNDTMGDYLDEKGRTVLIACASDRWGLAKGFADAGYDAIFGDVMFGLGIPLPIRKLGNVKTLAAITMPIVGRLPFEWIYPTGEASEKRTPRWEKYYEGATVIAGDFHMIKTCMPDDMNGKVIVTNTTTPQDVALLKELGVKYLVTTTPVYDGRSFGTNTLEAALVAVSGKKEPLACEEISDMIDKLGLKPELLVLNP